MGWFNVVPGGGERGGWLVTRYTAETRGTQTDSVSGTARRAQDEGRRGGAVRRLLKGAARLPAQLGFGVVYFLRA